MPSDNRRRYGIYSLEKESSMRFFFSKKSFDKAARQFVFSTQSKPKGLEKLSLAFIDSNGKKYFKYDDPLDMPMVRKGKLEKFYNWMASGMTDKELEQFTEAMDEALDSAINTMTIDGRIKNLARIKTIIDEMRNRKNLIIHEEVCFRIIGLQYIAEDQNPEIWDEELEIAKTEQFKKDSAGGLHDFFMGSPLRELVPFSSISEERLTSFLTEYRAALETAKKLITSTSGEQSLSEKKISSMESSASQITTPI